VLTGIVNKEIASKKLVLNSQKWERWVIGQALICAKCCNLKIAIAARRSLYLEYPFSQIHLACSQAAEHQRSQLQSKSGFLIKASLVVENSSTRKSISTDVSLETDRIIDRILSRSARLIYELSITVSTLLVSRSTR
jgi:hypothetical protein